MDCRTLRRQLAGGGSDGAAANVCRRILMAFGWVVVVVGTLKVDIVESHVVPGGGDNVGCAVWVVVLSTVVPVNVFACMVVSSSRTIWRRPRVNVFHEMLYEMVSSKFGILLNVCPILLVDRSASHVVLLW